MIMSSAVILEILAMQLLNFINNWQFWRFISYEFYNWERFTVRFYYEKLVVKIPKIYEKYKN